MIATRYLAPGFTVEGFRTALRAMCTEAWGQPTDYQPQAGYPYGHVYLEWPDFHGRKHFWGFTTSQMNSVVAASVVYNPNPSYRAQQSNPQVSFTPSDFSKPVYMMAFSGPDYRVVSVQTGTTAMFTDVVGLIRAPAFWWGTSDRVYITQNLNDFRTIPGLNPFGAIDPTTGNASPVGRTGYVMNRTATAEGLNTLINKRQVRLNDHYHDQIGILGYAPEVFARGGGAGLDANLLHLYDAGEAGLWVTLPRFGETAWLIRVDAPPFPGLTTHPAFVYDLANVEEVTPPNDEPCIFPYPSSGQAWPLLITTPTAQGTYPPKVEPQEP